MRKLLVSFVAASILFAGALFFTGCAQQHKFGNWVVVKQPTCVESGLEKRTCNDDDFCFETRVIDAIGHEFSDWTVAVQPTCSLNGVKTRVCLHDDSHIETATIHATGHDYGEWLTVIPATCDANGLKQRVCNHDDSHIQSQEIFKTGHLFGEWTITKMPTWEQTGSRTRVCLNDSSHVETEVMPVLTVDYSWYDSNPNANTFYIKNVQQFVGFANIVSGRDNRDVNCFENKTIELTRDIDLADIEWVPIGGNLTITPSQDGTYSKVEVAMDESKTFKGTLNGNGFYICNLTMTQNPASYNALFLSTLSAVVKNINFINVNLNNPTAVFATVVGYATDTIFENVTTSGTIVSRGGGGIVAILEGTNQSTKLINCESEVNLTVTRETGGIVVGGLVWQIVLNTSASTSLLGQDVFAPLFTNCAYLGTITVTVTATTTYVWAGQLFGTTSFSSPITYYNLVVTDCNLLGCLVITNPDQFNLLTAKMNFIGQDSLGTEVVKTHSEHHNETQQGFNVGIIGRVFHTLGLTIVVEDN